LEELYEFPDAGAEEGRSSASRGSGAVWPCNCLLCRAIARPIALSVSRLLGGSTRTAGIGVEAGEGVLDGEELADEEETLGSSDGGELSESDSADVESSGEGVSEGSSAAQQDLVVEMLRAVDELGTKVSSMLEELVNKSVESVRAAVESELEDVKAALLDLKAMLSESTGPFQAVTWGVQTPHAANGGSPGAPTLMGPQTGFNSSLYRGMSQAHDTYASGEYSMSYLKARTGSGSGGESDRKLGEEAGQPPTEAGRRPIEFSAGGWRQYANTTVCSDGEGRGTSGTQREGYGSLELLAELLRWAADMVRSVPREQVEAALKIAVDVGAIDTEKEKVILKVLEVASQMNDKGVDVREMAETLKRLIPALRLLSGSRG
jgi:hypothetical protein